MAPPPPATPASSSKFLLSKRPPSQSQQHQTPSQVPVGPRQFASTPRFSISSTPRPVSSQAGHFTTPAVLGPRSTSTQKRVTQIIDIESSPEESDDEISTARECRSGYDDIDANTSFNISQLPTGEHQEGRSPKRRRISISPPLDTSSPPVAHSAAPNHEFDIDIEPSVHSSQKSEGAFESSGCDSPSQSQDRDSEEPCLPASPRRFLLKTEPHPHAQQHQTFKPPQFKVSATRTTDLQPEWLLPDAFSPQRHGAKYVNGGLAAEMRDWLINVKGTSDAPPTTTGDTTADSIHIDKVRQGSRGMWLIQGHCGSRSSIQMILAGEGRLIGLVERRRLPTKGCKVIFWPPIWDIELEGQVWTVACDWYVVDEGV